MDVGYEMKSLTMLTFKQKWVSLLKFDFGVREERGLLWHILEEGELTEGSTMGES